MQVTEPVTYRFDGWTLQVDSGELARDGKVQRLTQQPLRVLVELLRNPGRVVTRERLVEVLWPKGVVDYDNGLNVAVRKLRRILGDESDTPRYIETLPRLGYRFIGRLESPPVEPLLTPVPSPTTTPATAPGAAGPKDPADVRWLIPVVVVAVCTAGVAWALLTRKPSMSHPPEPTAPIVARRTTSVRAYEAYLQGIFHRSRRDTDATGQAIAAFETALREDPEYAEAWAGLAETYIGAGIGHSIPAADAFAKAKEAALRSVRLDPGIPESHTALGQIHSFYDRDYAAAEAAFNRAIAANDKYARLWHHLGSLRAFQGRVDEALAALRRARELEPMTLLFSSSYALVLYHARRYDEAIAHARELLKTQPRLHQVQSLLIRSLVAKGEITEALQWLAQRDHEMPNISDAALVYAHAGQLARAREQIARIEELSARGFGVGYELAVAHAALGELEAGCKALDLAWRDASPFLGWMRLDPRMDPLRGEPCFSDVLQRFKGT